VPPLWGITSIVIPQKKAAGSTRLTAAFLIALFCAFPSLEKIPVPIMPLTVKVFSAIDKIKI